MSEEEWPPREDSRYGVIYGRWAGVKLTAEAGEQLFVPAGFAHGYCTLEPDTEIAYKCDAYYTPEAESGINSTDPEIGIKWPVPIQEMFLSERDRSLPAFRHVATPFLARDRV
jgi:dTDP-4-dehydrorhamnose 3,5-epimerase